VIAQIEIEQANGLASFQVILNVAKRSPELVKLMNYRQASIKLCDDSPQA
jgi:hypothetical protein